jgi:isovaleryl-CoA dehydrogenase
MAGFDLYNPTDTHRAVRETVRHFGARELEGQAARHDGDERFNESLFRRLGSELHLFGLTVPEADGGLGLDPVATVIVCEELSRFDPAFGLSYLAHEVLFVNNFYWSGNDEQRRRYLPAVLSGEQIAGMAMTEPSVGTDVLAMTTRARPDGANYLLDGTKQFITNGPVGSLFLVYAKIDEADDKVSAFIVESCFPGFSVGRKEQKMGMRASPTSQLVLDGCVVPADNILGEPNGALVSMMRNLEIERVALAAQSLGIALRCVDEMLAYADARSAFGKKLHRFGQMQQRIADSYAETLAARALVYDVAQRITPYSRNTLGAASAKLVATPAAERAARNAIQVLGGYGYVTDYPVERFLRDAILLSIGGGTIEAMQKNIVNDLLRARSDR